MVLWLKALIWEILERKKWCFSFQELQPFESASRSEMHKMVLRRRADHVSKLTWSANARYRVTKEYSLKKKITVIFPRTGWASSEMSSWYTNVFYIDAVWTGQMCKGRVAHINSNRSCQFGRIHVALRTHANHSTHHNKCLNPPTHHRSRSLWDLNTFC